MPTTARVSLLLIILILSTATLFADNKIKVGRKPAWVSEITSPDWSPPDREISEGSFLMLYEYQVNVSTQEEYAHITRKLKNETGIQNNSDIQIVFDPSFQTLTFHHIKIIRGEKEIDVTNASKFKLIQQETDLSRFIYNGTYTAYFVFDDLRAGDIIDFDYTIKGNNPVFKGKYYERFYFQGGEPIRHAYYSVIFPEDRTPQYKNNNNAPEVVKTSIPGSHSIRYSWSAEKLKARFGEDYEPYWYDAFPNVQVSEMNSWNEVVEWGCSINPSYTKKSAAIDSISSAIAKQTNTLTDYILACTRFVQDEVRYMGIESGVYSHKPHEPEVTLKNRYGDCKDKSLLLCALLAARNLESYPVYINTSLRDHVDERIPSPLNFNHCVSVVYLENIKLWIDPTIPLQRGSLEDLYFPAYGKGLVLKKGENSLTEIQENNKGKAIVAETFDLADTGRDGFIRVETTYMGETADDERYLFRNNSMEAMQEGFTDYYSGIYDSVTVDDDLRMTDDESRNRISMNESYRISNPWSETDSLKYRFTITAQLLKNCLTILPKKERHAPLLIKHPNKLDYTININTPEDWNVSEEKFHVNNPAFDFTFNAEKKGKGFTLRYVYESRKSVIPVQDIRQYNRDIDSVLAQLEYTITWNRNQSAIAAANAFRLNISYLVISIFLSLVLVYIAVRVYRISLQEEVQEGLHIGSWLVLPLIGLALTPFNVIYQLVTNNFFDDTAISNLKNSSQYPGVTWDALLIFELAGNIILLVLAILCFISFIKRRDITARLMVTYYIYAFVIVALDQFITARLNIGESSPADSTLVRSFIGCALWVPVFLISSRVKNTFVKPYRPAGEDSDYNMIPTAVSDVTESVTIPVEHDNIQSDVNEDTAR
jgi:transglutaminase-like putative cysteine protease